MSADAAATAFGPTFFDSLKRSFVDVGVSDAGTSTGDFLEACEGLIKMFDYMNPTAMAPVVADLNGNVAKIRAKLLANPTTCDTLERMLESERGQGKGARVATEALLWLLRGLHFTSTAINACARDSSKELTTAFGDAYSVTLRQYHNFLVRGVVTLALKAAPYRQDFLRKLGQDQARVASQLKAWGDALEALVAKMQKYMADHKLDQPPF